MFEQAREQMEAGIAEIKNSATEQVSTQTQEPTKQDGQTPTAAEAKAIAELEKLERFKFEGREWTAKDLKNAIMMKQDYTRKTQALCEDRNAFSTDKKYYDNLQADLKAVWNDPSLAQEFLKTYPEQFHGYMEMLNNARGAESQNGQARQESQASQPAQNQIPPELQRYIQKIDQIESKLTAKEVEALESHLENLTQKMQAKYPSADELQVLATADGLRRQGAKLDDAMWERIWSETHNRTEKLFEQRYNTMFKQQSDASKSAKDIAPGGGIPGQAPKTFSSFKEASQAAIQDLTRRQQQS